MDRKSRAVLVRRGFRRIGLVLALTVSGYILYDRGSLSLQTLNYNQAQFIALRCAATRVPPGFEIPKQNRSVSERIFQDTVSQFMAEMERKRKRDSTAGMLDPVDVPVDSDGSAIDLYKLGCGFSGSASPTEIERAQEQSFSYFRAALALFSQDFSWAVLIGGTVLAAFEVLSWVVRGFFRN